MFKAAINSSPSNGSTPSNGNTLAIGNTPPPSAAPRPHRQHPVPSGGAENVRLHPRQYTRAE